MPPGGSAGVRTLAVGAVALSSAYRYGLFNVDGGHRAVIFNRVTDVKESVYGEGTHFRIPLIDMPVTYDVRAKPRNIQSLTGSRNLQMITITLRVLSSSVEICVAQFNASQLITQREQVSRRYTSAQVSC